MGRDSKLSNSIVQLRKIPHSQTQVGFTPEGFGLMATSAMREMKAMQQGTSTANLEMQSIGNGKFPNLPLVCCHTAKVCGRAHVADYAFAFTRLPMPGYRELISAG